MGEVISSNSENESQSNSLQAEQKQALLKFASLLKENQERLHWLEAVLVGKDFGFSMFECALAAEVITCTGILRNQFGSRLTRSQTTQTG